MLFNRSFNNISLGVSAEDFTCVPIQGSGTFAVEAVFQTAVQRKGGKVKRLMCILVFRFAAHVSSENILYR